MPGKGAGETPAAVAVLLHGSRCAKPSYEFLVDLPKTAKTVSFAPRNVADLLRLLGGLQLHLLGSLANAAHLIRSGLVVAVSTLPLENYLCRRIWCSLLYNGCIQICCLNI